MKRDRIKKVIENLIEEYSVDDLNVRVICERAEIGKQTLYNNYFGILGAVDRIVEDYVRDASADHIADLDWIQIIRSLLDMLVLKKNFFQHLYFSKYSQEVMNSIARALKPVVEEMVANCETQDIKPNDKSKRVLVYFYLDTYMGIIERFIRNQMKDDPDEIARIYEEIFKDHSTRTILREMSV